MTSRSLRKSWVVWGVVLGVLAPLALAGPATAPSTGTGAGRVASSTKPLRVLFVGNSYTYYNGGLGSLVQSLASGVKGGRKFEYVEVTKGGQTLEGHWKDGRALAEIRKGGWDYVVLQEHSTRPLVDREKMYAAARAFDAEIQKAGAKTVFYETWARKNRPETQAGLDQAYGGIAKEVSAMVAPAGMAWAKALETKPGLALHIGDMSHPTPAGSYLNACVFFEVLFGQSPQGLPRTLRSAAGKVLVDLSEGDAALLQLAAYQTCGRGGGGGSGAKAAE